MMKMFKGVCRGLAFTLSPMFGMMIMSNIKETSVHIAELILIFFIGFCAAAGWND